MSEPTTQDRASPQRELESAEEKDPFPVGKPCLIFVPSLALLSSHRVFSPSFQEYLTLPEDTRRGCKGGVSAVGEWPARQNSVPSGASGTNDLQPVFVQGSWTR